MAEHQHEPLVDPSTKLPITIGGLMDHLRAHVCQRCGALYVEPERMSEWLVKAKLRAEYEEKVRGIVLGKSIGRKGKA